MSNDNNLLVASSPHLHSEDNVKYAMRDVAIALLPISAVSIYWFGLNALFLIVLCMATAALTEVVFRRMLNRPKKRFDGSVMVTGLLVALCFSVETGWWTAIIATVIAVGIAKELMGGLGWNLFNPALFGRVSAVVFAPLLLNQVNRVFSSLNFSLGQVDVVSQATPLALIQQGGQLPPLGAMFLAFPGGALAETSALALIIGGAFLLYRKHIRWHIPVAMIGTVAVMALIFETSRYGVSAPFYHVFGGGVLLGAFFMATDWVTSPITNKGKLIFGVSIGLLIMIFRLFLAPVEGTAFSILIMNAFVPFIDRATKRPRFGEAKAAVRVEA